MGDGCDAMKRHGVGDLGLVVDVVVRWTLFLRCKEIPILGLGKQTLDFLVRSRAAGAEALVLVRLGQGSEPFLVRSTK